MAPSIGDSLHKMISSDERDYAAREVAPVGSLPGTIRRKRRVRVVGTSLATVAAVGAIALVAPYLSPAPVDPAGPTESGQKYDSVNWEVMDRIFPVNYLERCGQPAPKPTMGEDGLFISVTDAPEPFDLAMLDVVDQSRNVNPTTAPVTATVRLANDRPTPTSALYTLPQFVYTQNGVVVAVESSGWGDRRDFGWISLEQGDLAQLRGSLLGFSPCGESGRDEEGYSLPMLAGTYEVYAVVTVEGGQGPAAARALLDQGVDPGSFLSGLSGYSQGNWYCRRDLSTVSNPDFADRSLYPPPAECVEGTDFDPETGSIAVSYPPEYYGDEFKARLVSEPFTVVLTGVAPEPPQHIDREFVSIPISVLSDSSQQCGVTLERGYYLEGNSYMVMDELSISSAEANRRIRNLLAGEDLSVGLVGTREGRITETVTLHGDATVVVMTGDPTLEYDRRWDGPLRVVAVGTGSWGSETEHQFDWNTGPTFVPIDMRDFNWCPGAETDEDLYLYVVGNATTTTYVDGEVNRTVTGPLGGSVNSY